MSERVDISLSFVTLLLMFWLRKQGDITFDSPMTVQHRFFRCFLFWFCFLLCIFGDLIATNTYMKCSELLGVVGISLVFYSCNMFYRKKNLIPFQPKSSYLILLCIGFSNSFIISRCYRRN